jgi:hypothetical protein
LKSSGSVEKVGSRFGAWSWAGSWSEFGGGSCTRSRIQSGSKTGSRSELEAESRTGQDLGQEIGQDLGVGSRTEISCLMCGTHNIDLSIWVN